MNTIKTNFRILGTSIVSAGSGIFALQTAYSQSLSEIKPYTTPSISILIGVGVILIAISLLYPMVSHPRGIYVQRKIKINEIQEFHDECVSMFGSNITPLEEARRWLNKNKNLIWNVVKITHPVEGENICEKVGFYELFPLTRQAVKKIETENLDGRTLKTEHIAKESNKPYGFYIGGIAAKYSNPRVRFAVMLLFFELIDQKLQGGPLVLFARPVTKNGLRLVLNFNFQKIYPNLSDTESVWKLEINSAKDLDVMLSNYRLSIKKYRSVKQILPNSISIERHNNANIY